MIKKIKTGKNKMPIKNQARVLTTGLKISKKKSNI